MTNPISAGLSIAPTPIDTETIDAMASSIRAQGPTMSQDARLPEISTERGSTGQGLGAAPPLDPPTPMSLSQVTLLVNQLMNKAQDTAATVSQKDLENLNKEIRAQNAKINQSIQKMIKAQQHAKKDSKIGSMGLSSIHNKTARTFAKIGIDLGIGLLAAATGGAIAGAGVAVAAGITAAALIPQAFSDGAGIAAGVESGKAGRDGAKEEDQSAKFATLQKFVTKQDDYLSAIAKGLEQTASVTSEMNQGQQSAQQTILSGLNQPV